MYSCSYFSKYHINDLNIINDLDIETIYFTFKNINNKWCDYNLINFLKNNLLNYTFIKNIIYKSRTQKMILIKFEKKI